MTTYKFIVTFTQSDVLRKNCYTIVEVEHEDIIHAESLGRSMAFDTYGGSWSNFYDSEDEAGVEKFNLKYIPFGN